MWLRLGEIKTPPYHKWQPVGGLLEGRELTKDDAGYEKFVFSPDQLEELHMLLGNSKETELFLASAEGWVNQAIWVREKDKYGITSLAQMKVRLRKYEEHCKQFLQSMSELDEGLITESEQAAELDWRAILLIEGAELPGLGGRVQKSEDGIVSEVLAGVRKIGELCSEAINYVPQSRRGDLSADETMLQLTEDGIVGAYLEAFGCYPAKTNGGAFHEAMKIVYRSAGYSHSNSYQRLHKAIDRYAQASGHDPVPDQFKPKRNLHPG